MRFEMGDPGMKTKVYVSFSALCLLAVFSLTAAQLEDFQPSCVLSQPEYLSALADNVIMLEVRAPGASTPGSSGPESVPPSPSHRMWRRSTRRCERCWRSPPFAELPGRPSMHGVVAVLVLPVSWT